MRQPTRSAAMLVALLALGACTEPAPTPPAASAPEERGDAVHLGVPPGAIQRARGEALGLSRMPDGLRRLSLERGREAGSPPYSELRAGPDAHQNARVSYEGRVGLVRPAGEELWILALMTRCAGTRWVDPLYVLSVVRPEVPEGATARVDGWVVGERTIGRHALPLIVAFNVEARVEPDR